MTKRRFPRYMRPRQLSGGLIGWWFQPPTWAIKAGCPLKVEPLGTDFELARNKSHGVLLPQFDAWRQSRKGTDVAIPNGPRLGTLDWLFTEYAKTWDEVRHDRLKPLGAGQQRNHRSSINLVGNYLLPNDQRLGTWSLRAFTEQNVADLFKNLLFKKNDDGTCLLDEEGNKIERRTTVNAAMRMCRAAWNEVGPKYRSIVPHLNPFANMGLISSSEETPTATYPELETFVAKADELGYSSIGTGAMIAWEWLQREKAIFATLEVGHYRHKAHPDCVLTLHPKTGKQVWWPLFDEDGTPFLPTLMARLDAAKQDRVGLMLVRDWGDRGPWPTYPKKMKGEPDLSHVARITKEIIEAAGLRPELTFRSFRHGGMTEGGESGMTDREMVAQSAHTTPKELPDYSKRTLKVVANGLRKRLAGRSPTAAAKRAVAVVGEQNVLRLTHLSK